MHGLRGKNLLQFLRVTQVCMKRLYGKSITSTNERVITYRFDITCRTDSTIVAGPDIYVGRGPRAMYFAKYSGPVHLLYLPSNWTCSSAEVKDARGEYRYPKTNCLITKFTYFIPSLSTVKAKYRCRIFELENWGESTASQFLRAVQKSDGWPKISSSRARDLIAHASISNNYTYTYTYIHAPFTYPTWILGYVWIADVNLSQWFIAFTHSRAPFTNEGQS